MRNILNSRHQSGQAQEPSSLRVVIPEVPLVVRFGQEAGAGARRSETGRDDSVNEAWAHRTSWPELGKFGHDQERFS